MIRMLAALILMAMPVPAIAGGTAERREVIEKAADLIEKRYVHPDAGKRIAGQLRRSSGDLLKADTDKDFAAAFTQRLRSVSGDGHFAITRDPQARVAAEGEATDPAELERWYGKHVNHGFHQISRLEDGIGYLDLRVFAPVSMAGDMAEAAMTLLAQSPALIIDLRKNGGGMDDMTRLLAAYLLDESREMSAEYNRPRDRTTRHFTPASVEGRRFGGAKPVYILVSRRTFSAAEAFAYDLQAMKRAVVVGEQTGGGAHPYADRPVAHGFIMSLPEGRSINPITGTNWEGTGVTPDIRVPADAALEEALAMARQAIGGEAGAR